MRMVHNTRRLVNRVRRSVDNVGFVERRSRSRYLTAKRQHRALATSQQRIEVPTPLRHDGYHLTTLDELGVGNASEVLQGLSALANGLAAKPCPDSDAVFTIWAGDAEILEYPAVFHLGLQPAVLDLVEAYLGFAPAYHGAYVRRDFPRVSTGRSRLWHLDLEDHRMFKLVIYVRDVTEADGPLELVSAPVSRRIVREHGYAGGWINQPAMQQSIESAKRHTVVGKAGTVVLVDPSRVLHRGGPLEQGHERYTVFYDFTTSRPRRPYYCKSSVEPQTVDVFRADLDERQRRAIDWRVGV